MMSRPRPSLAPYSRFPVQEFLRRTAARLPEKTAVIDGERRFTFRQLEEYSGRLGAALASFGVRRDEHVALLAPNCAEFVIAFYGILKAGAIVTTINSGYREREIAHQLNDSGAEVVIVHADLEPVLESAREEAPGLRRVVPIEPTALPGSFWDAIDRAPTAPPAPVVRPDEDVATLPYSSGTTGLSKGVMLTHANLVSNVEQMVGREGEESVPREDDVILVHLPLFHIYGMNVLMNPAVAVGATQVMMGRFDMDRFLRLISRRRVTQALHRSARRPGRDAVRRRVGPRPHLAQSGILWRSSDVGGAPAPRGRGAGMHDNPGIWHDRDLASGQLRLSRAGADQARLRRAGGSGHGREGSRRRDRHEGAPRR